jgi:hypothetical protein
MKYTVDYLSEKKIVEIKLQGRLNFQIAEQYSKEALKLARDNDCKKFLFDHKETIMNGPVTNIHTSGDEFQQFGYMDTDQIAIVIEKPNSDPNVHESENQNAHWSEIKYFSANSIKNAYNWLLGIAIA